MAIEVTVDTTIERSPQAVFERIADVEAWPAWLIASGITAVHRTSSGPIAHGESLVVEQVAAGRPGTFTAEVAALEVPSRLVVSGRDDDGIWIEIEATLAPTEGTTGTATALRWTIRIGLPFRLRIFEGIARPQVERAVALDLEALRRRLESTAPD